MTQQDRSDGLGEPVRGDLVPAATESMREWAEQLVARAREDGVALTGEGGLLISAMRVARRRLAVSATGVTVATTRR